MTNEEIVMTRLNNSRSLGKSPIGFKVNRNNWERDELFYQRKQLLDSEIKVLKEIDNIEDRVNKILMIARHYPTYFTGTNRFQCCAGARRSTVDIWRIYKSYFEEVDIFTIMRALFKLVDSKDNLNTYKCSTVRKRVFWFKTMFDEYKDYYTPAELGVSFSEWKEIGLHQE